MDKTHEQRSLVALELGNQHVALGGFTYGFHARRAWKIGGLDGGAQTRQNWPLSRLFCGHSADTERQQDRNSRVFKGLML